MTQDFKKILKTGLIFFLFLIIVIFAFWGSKELILGVKIKNINIVNGSKITENPLKIIGNAKNAKTLILNGREISIDQNGYFNETVALLPGYNIIELKAVDKFGNQDNKDYKLIYQNNE